MPIHLWYARAVSSGERASMFENEAEKARATAEDLIRVLSAYDDELGDLTQDTPGVVALRDAIGAALAEACQCILDRDADLGGPGRITH
jgi:hypothetical protein